MFPMGRCIRSFQLPLSSDSRPLSLVSMWSYCVTPKPTLDISKGKYFRQIHKWGKDLLKEKGLNFWGGKSLLQMYTGESKNRTWSKTMGILTDFFYSYGWTDNFHSSVFLFVFDFCSCSCFSFVVVVVCRFKWKCIMLAKSKKKSDNRYLKLLVLANIKYLGNFQQKMAKC